MTQVALRKPRFAKLADLVQALKSMFVKEHVPHWTEFLRDDVRK